MPLVGGHCCLVTLGTYAVLCDVHRDSERFVPREHTRLHPRHLVDGAKEVVAMREGSKYGLIVRMSKCMSSKADICLLTKHYLQHASIEA